MFWKLYRISSDRMELLHLNTSNRIVDFTWSPAYNAPVLLRAQGTTLLTEEELKRIYFDKRRAIRNRLAEFSRVGRTGSTEALFEELTFCIFTAGASARMGLRSVESVR